MLFAAACPCVEIPVPEASDAAARDAAIQVHRAVALADGPVHINLAFRKPLEPSPDEVVPAPFELPLLRRPLVAVEPAKIEQLLERCQATTKGVIVCGPLADAKLARSVQMLARKLAFPLLAESTSGARFAGEKAFERIDGFTHILGIPSLASALQPEIILQFGTAPASGPLLRWLEAGGATRVHFTGSQPWRTRQETVELLPGDAASACQTLVAQATQQSGSEYLDAWRDAERRCWNAVEHELARESHGLSEAKAISAVLRGLAADTQLTIGNSLPIRSTDSVISGEALQLRVLHQRGTSGIEGLIAGALGSAHSGRSALLLGDVSCAHDLSSLALHEIAEGPLLIVVIDNGGGKIFSHLPVAGLGLPKDDWTFWETPPRVDFGLACAAYGVAHRLCKSEDELASALRWAQSTTGVSMVQVKVQPDSMRTFLSNVQGALA
jgi:2-succinyl-5-enolpyruvyl-6-hydroxy-3-cyclohexene-1-carboxylate synthase